MDPARRDAIRRQGHLGALVHTWDMTRLERRSSAGSAALPDASAWALDPDVAYLNHGGFGAAPSAVRAEQRAWQDAMERYPARFLVHELPGLLDKVRQQLADFLGADADGLVFTDNATTGTQTVIAQAGLTKGDEVLVTDHCYPAVLTQLRRLERSTGMTLRVVPVPLPAGDRAAVAGTVLAGLSSRTRLVVIDQVASGTGMIFPVQEITAECRRHGVPVLIDGAHAAGLLPLDLASIGADFWTGNLHKWICAPKASAVLHVAPQWRDTIRPLVASHGFADGFRPAFDWTGTRDPSAILAVPAALKFFEDAGWETVRQRNSDLAKQGADLVSERIGTTSPEMGELAAAMRLIQLPAPIATQDRREVERQLFEQHRIVVPVMYQYAGGPQWLRVSAQLYNTLSDYERLADALAELGQTRPA